MRVLLFPLFLYCYGSPQEIGIKLTVRWACGTVVLNFDTLPANLSSIYDLVRNMASGSSNLYSQGCNFTSFLQKGVDPRTGQYTCSVDLYKTPAQARNCPAFKLSLNFNPLSAGDLNFGKGWSLNLPYYDPSAGIIFTSTGEQYHVTETTTFVRLDDLKLESFRVERVTVNGEVQYRLIYKSGHVEILSRDKSNRYARAELKKLYAPSGRSLEFEWELWGNGNRRLKKIKEGGSQTLVEIDYERRPKTITGAPGTAEACTYSLHVPNARLEWLELPVADKPKWSFKYENKGPLLCSTQVVNPSGLLESVAYEVQGHRLPSGHPSYTSIPRVLSHTLWPFQGQPNIVSSYNYSGTNFLGYGSGLSWTKNGDNLYLARHDYDYWTEVTVGGKTTKTTYNKYHLMTKSEQRKGTKSVLQQITYFAETMKPFAEQEAYCQLPESVETTYSDTAGKEPRKEVTTYTYDNAGNPTKEIQPDGRTITRKYYNPDGENNSGTGESCPADPLGFQRYLREETVTPPTNEYDAPVRKQSYTYVAIPTVANALRDYFVAAREEHSFECTEAITRTEYTYVSQPSSRDHGRLLQQIDSIFGEHSTTHSWAYNYQSSD
jgi:YD repeat-containing protein